MRNGMARKFDWSGKYLLAAMFLGEGAWDFLFSTKISTSKQKQEGPKQREHESVLSTETPSSSPISLVPHQGSVSGRGLQTYGLA